MTTPSNLSSNPKDRVARLYSSVAVAYQEKGPPFFAHAGNRLVEIAGVKAGDTVLDVAAGRGAVLFPAADRVGPDGRVVGIDLAGGMVTQTRAEIAQRGLSHAEMRHMDAEALDFPDASFTHALCSFAVFFFPDLPRVLSEMLRVLRPGGTVGFAFTRGYEQRWLWYEQLLRKVGAFDGLPPSPGSDNVRQPNVLAAALSDAGFADATETLEETDLFTESPEMWWESLWTHGSRVALERLSPETIERVKSVSLKRAHAMIEPGGLRHHYTFVYVTATKP
jgi:ubiquinone/menaquinone biosynthesis C-methylase UbiE